MVLTRARTPNRVHNHRACGLILAIHCLALLRLQHPCLMLGNRELSHWLDSLFHQGTASSACPKFISSRSRRLNKLHPSSPGPTTINRRMDGLISQSKIWVLIAGAAL